MKNEYKVFIGIIVVIIGAYFIVDYLDNSKYEEDNAALELLVNRLRADSIVSANIIAGSEHREDSMLQDNKIKDKKIWRYKTQRDGFKKELLDNENHNYSAVPDSLKQHNFDSLLTRLDSVQGRFDNTIKDD